jgi:hypothetical protein
VEQLLEAAQGSSLLFGVVGLVYIGLVVVLAITAAFASKPSRQKAALDVLRVVWVRRGTSLSDDNGAGGNRDASSSEARHPSRGGE